MAKLLITITTKARLGDKYERPAQVGVILSGKNPKLPVN